MKQKYLLFTLLFLVFISLKSKASVSLSSFTASNSYDGKIYSPNGISFTASFDFVRAGDGFPITVELIYVEGSTETVISSAGINKTNWGTETIWSSSIQGTLTSTQTQGRVFLKYTIFDGLSNGTYRSGSSYSITLQPPPNPGVGTPPPSAPPVPGSKPLYYYSQSLGGCYLSSEWLGQSVVISDGLHSGTRDFVGIIGYVFTVQQPGTVMLNKFRPNPVRGARIDRTEFIFSTLTTYPGCYKIGEEGYVYTSQVTKTLPVYSRAINNSEYHYYNTQPASIAGENIEITEQHLEGIAFYLLQSPQSTTYPLPENDTMELYQYYSNRGDHFYTTLKKDRPGFTYEKVLGYVHTIQKSGTIPLHRYVNTSSSSGDHYYTTDKQNYGWYIYEGIVGYVYGSDGMVGTSAVYSYFASSIGDHYYNTVNSSYGGYVNEGIKFYMLTYNH
ncbi:hypothetical protein [Pedobacter terrae]|uniref:hypothetical protein n=1 Tax=Pedobacter terrae TaxID=405671 RepID=UPI002FF686F4